MMAELLAYLDGSSQFQGKPRIFAKHKTKNKQKSFLFSIFHADTNAELYAGFISACAKTIVLLADKWQGKNNRKSPQHHYFISGSNFESIPLLQILSSFGATH